jgi:hypothetical protein
MSSNTTPTTTVTATEALGLLAATYRTIFTLGPVIAAAREAGKPQSSVAFELEELRHALLMLQALRGGNAVRE